MEWQVLWHEQVGSHLQEILRGSRHQQLIVAAARHVDTILQKEPETAGESREGSLRILVEWPIVVHFIADDTQHVVLVVDFWLYGLSSDQL